MRHQVRERKLGRTSAHYEATRRNFVVSLLRHGRIKTTVAKAKAFRAYAEKMITLAKKNLEVDIGTAPTDREERKAWVARNRPEVARRLHNVRQAVSQLQDKEIVKLLFDEIAPRYKDRPGGYTRVIKLSKPRLGDAAPTAFLELVGEGDSRTDRLPKGRRKKRKRTSDAAQAAPAVETAAPAVEETAQVEEPATEPDAPAAEAAPSDDEEQ